MRTLLITGGSGYLGARLFQVASASGAWEVHTTYLSTPLRHPNATQLDLRNRAQVQKAVAALRPDVVIHQAISNRSDEHVAAIVPAARHIVEAALDNEVRLIHVSTDLVFDGEHPPYAEESPVAPVNPYGAAKAFAEGLITSIMPEALVVRSSLIYGFDPMDKATAWLVEGMRRGETVRLFTDEIRCPIWVDTVANALLELADSKHGGILNLGGPPLSRWDFGVKMLACLGLRPSANVVRSPMAESGLKRPANLTLDVSKAKRLLQTPLINIEEAHQRHQALKARPNS